MSPSKIEVASNQPQADRRYGPVDALPVSTLRAMSMDASFKAKSEHPGAEMGLAPVAHVLFHKMRFNPITNKSWINRDRFVLSNGRACSLLYTILHLFGYELTMDDLKSFRQLGSKPRVIQKHTIRQVWRLQLVR